MTKSNANANEHSRTGRESSRRARSFYRDVLKNLAIFSGVEDWQNFYESPEQLMILDAARTIGNLDEDGLFGISEVFEAVEAEIRWKHQLANATDMVILSQGESFDDLPRRADGTWLGDAWESYFSFVCEDEDPDEEGSFYREIHIEVDGLTTGQMADLIYVESQGWLFDLNAHQALIAPGSNLTVRLYREEWGGYRKDGNKQDKPDEVPEGSRHLSQATA